MVPELATWALPGGSQGIQSHRSYLKTTASESEFSHYTDNLDSHWKQRIELEVASLPSLTVTTHLRNLFLVSNFSFCRSKASGSQKWNGPHTTGHSIQPTKTKNTTADAHFRLFQSRYIHEERSYFTIKGNTLYYYKDVFLPQNANSESVSQM